MGAYMIFFRAQIACRQAEKKNIQYAVIIGSKELEEETCVVKDLNKGEQEIIKQEILINFFAIK